MKKTLRCFLSSTVNDFQKSFKRFVGTAFLLLFTNACFSQTKLDSILNKLDPQKYSSIVAGKAKKFEKKLVRKSEEVLEKMQKQEEKIYRKMLGTKDSLLAKSQLVEIKDRYAILNKFTPTWQVIMMR